MASGSLAATGDSEELLAVDGDFSYKLNFARTSGTLVYDLGFTEGRNVSYSLTGTWVGTVTLLRKDKQTPGASYVTLAGISETANTTKTAF